MAGVAAVAQHVAGIHLPEQAAAAGAGERHQVAELLYLRGSAHHALGNGRLQLQIGRNGHDISRRKGGRAYQADQQRPHRVEPYHVVDFYVAQGALGHTGKFGFGGVLHHGHPPRSA